MYWASPPSEPCRRIFRTRLSDRWFTFVRVERPTHGAAAEKQPRCGKEGVRPMLMISRDYLPPFTLVMSAVNMRSVQTCVFAVRHVE
jgi:hypothetical protein